MFISTFSIIFRFIVRSSVEGPLKISFIAEGCPSLNIFNKKKLNEFSPCSDNVKNAKDLMVDVNSWGLVHNINFIV